MSNPGSILVVRLSAIGDIVLASAVAAALRERFPHARLEFLARDPPGRVLRGLPGLDSLHLWGGGPPPLGVRDRTWDVLVDLSATGRSRRLLAGVRASRRLRVRKQTLRRFAFVKLRALGGSGSGLVPLLDRMFAAVAPLGVWREGRRPHFPGPPPPLDGPVLLAPGAGRATKRWPAERFGEVARRLSAEGERVVVAGAEAERRLLEEVARGSAAEVVAVADPSGIPDVAARSPRAVTNDSAWLHVAEACGATVVAIFGPTHPSLGFAPAAPGSVAIHAGVACSPCDLHGPDRCPKRHHRCMGDVTAERVLAELRARRQARSAA